MDSRDYIAEFQRWKRTLSVRMCLEVGLAEDGSVSAEEALHIFEHAEETESRLRSLVRDAGVTDLVFHWAITFPEPHELRWLLILDLQKLGVFSEVRLALESAGVFRIARAYLLRSSADMYWGSQAL